MMKETLRSHAEGSLENFELTRSQAEAASKLDSFLTGDTPLFLLKGYAGTGKTFLIKALARYLNHTGREFCLMAPTGRAAKVLREKTGFTAYTIHKAIYDFSKLKEYKFKEKDGSETYRFYFGLRGETHNTDTIFILDEASMISDNYNDDEFIRFGSGYLLSDLLHFAAPGPGLKRKNIFVGDIAQLPPVNMATSPALNKEYLKDHYELESEEYLITDVVRQKEDSGILANAILLRDSIYQRTYNWFKLDTGYPDITRLPAEEIINTYRAKSGSKVDEGSIVIAYSNRKVHHYNQMMRDFFFPGQKSITPGDRVLVVKNNYNFPVEVFNGDFGFITAVSDQTETRAIPLRKLKQIENIELTFRDIEIEFRGKDSKPARFGCKMIENLLLSPERDLSADEKRALYIDFKIRHPKLKPGDLLFAEKLKKDPYFNCLFLKFGYAVTCHKAQGGEWDKAFVDFQTDTGYQTEAYYRWAYTAMTRGKEHLFAVNPPQIEMYEGLTQATAVRVTLAKVLVLPPQAQNAHELYSFPPGGESLKQICCAVHHVLTGSPYMVERISHLQYCERYHFIGTGNGTHQADLIYNKYGIITKVQFPPQTDQAFQADVLNLLNSLVGIEIVTEGETPLAQAGYVNIEQTCEKPPFPEDKPFLEEFYNTINQILSAQQILITGIQHHNYLEKYDFSRGYEKMGLDFYYDKKGCFTRYLPQPKRSNSDELLRDIQALLVNLINAEAVLTHEK